MAVDFVLADNALRQKVTVLRPSGGNDGTLINAALAAAAATVGVGNTPGTVATKPVVQLTGGVFNINTPIILGSLVHLQGAGFGTVLKAKTALNDDVVLASGAQMWGTTISRLTIDGNKANQSAGHGLHWQGHGSFSPYVSGTHVVGGGIDCIEDLFIVNAFSDGLHIDNQAGELRVRAAVSFGAGRDAISVNAPDCMFSDCTGAGCGRYGLLANSQTSRYFNIKVYGTNEVATGFATAVLVSSDHNFFTNCEVQECPNDGWWFGGTASGGSGTATGNTLRACASKGVGGYHVNIRGATGNDIDIRGQDGFTYAATGGVLFGTGSTGNRIRFTQYESANPAVPTTGGNTTRNNSVIVSGSEGSQSVAYAASITPAPYSGERIVVGTLTGDLAVANPAAGTFHDGQKMRLQFTQDGTGGRAVTFGNAFLASYAIDTAASATSVLAFTYDDVLAKWVQDSILAAPISAVNSLSAALASTAAYNLTTGFATVTNARTPASTADYPVVTGRTLQIRAVVGFNNATAGDTLGARIVDDSAGTILVSNTFTAAGASETWKTAWVNASATTTGWYIQAENTTSARGNVQRAHIEHRYV